jgi:hypothetical protein
MRRWGLFVLALLFAAASHAQSGGGYDLSWWTIDGGGVTFATGGTFDLGGTVGQPDASNPLTGGAFSLTGASGLRRASSPTAMWTATAVWTTRTCCRCCSPSGRRG